MERKRVLVFAPGRVRDEARYYLPGHNVEPVLAKCSPVALVALQRQAGVSKRDPDTIIALATDEVRKPEEWRQVEAALAPAGIPIEPVGIPDGTSGGELREIVLRLLRAIPDDCDVTLDITHGFRSVPFVFTVAMQYLTLMKQTVHIDGLYYGMLSKTADSLTPLVDLSVYLKLMDWVYAARVFRDTLVPAKLVELIGELPASSERGTALRDALLQFSTALDAAMPIEIGKSAVAITRKVSNIHPDELGEEVLLPDVLLGSLKSLASEFVPGGGVAVCEKLDVGELKRQARLIDRLLVLGRIAQAAGLIREWLVLMVIFNGKRPEQWRDRNARADAEKMLAGGHGLESREMNDACAKLIEIRNYLHHYGQTDADHISLSNIPSAVKKHWGFVKQKIDAPGAWRVRS